MLVTYGLNIGGRPFGGNDGWGDRVNVDPLPPRGFAGTSSAVKSMEGEALPTLEKSLSNPEKALPALGESLLSVEKALWVLAKALIPMRRALAVLGEALSPVGKALLPTGKALLALEVEIKNRSDVEPERSGDSRRQIAEGK
jgi:hypothetical protein